MKTYAPMKPVSPYMVPQGNNKVNRDGHPLLPPLYRPLSQTEVRFQA